MKNDQTKAIGLYGRGILDLHDLCRLIKCKVFSMTDYLECFIISGFFIIHNYFYIIMFSERQSILVRQSESESWGEIHSSSLSKIRLVNK